MNVAMRSLADDLGELATTRAGERAVIDARTGRVWTYRSLMDAALEVARLLRGEGVRPSARVLSLLPNGVDQMAAFLGTLLVGADFCPLSPLSTLDEARRFARLCRPSVALVPTGGAVPLGTIETDVAPRAIAFALRGDGTGPTGRKRFAERAGKLILFTSGTTALPKAMVLDADRLWSSAKAWVSFHDWLTPAARFYDVLPMSYLGGLFNLALIPLAAGGSIVVSDAYSAASIFRFWREIDEHGVNTLWLSPTMVRSLLALQRRDRREAHRHVGTSFVGMAPSKPEEKRAFEAAFGVRLLENFALSETTFISSEKAGEREEGAGRILPWVEVRLRQDAALPAPEILVRSPFLFDGYLTPDGDTDPARDAAGFFHTGDLGELVDDRLTLRGRHREIVKRGGYLVVLAELEEVARSHPDVADAVALGAPDDFYGEVPILRLVVHPEARADDVLQGVRGLVAERLAKFKWPRDIAVVTSLPRGAGGKVQRHAVEEFAERLATVRME